MSEPGDLTIRANVHMQWDVRIPLRDGVSLSAIAYLPKAAPAGPVVVTMTPYIAQTWHEYGLYFAAHGYPFLAVDVRGRGNSAGVFRPLVNDGPDGFDVVEWLARQPYCNGRVAMWGGSYAGFNQWATAKEFPPHLATIVPTAAPYAGLDFPIRNNIPSTYQMQWLMLVAGRTSQDKLFWNNERFWGERFRDWFESGVPFRQLDSVLGCPSVIFHEWLDHPHQDLYWDQCNPRAEQYAQISHPVLTITGMYDGNQPGALTHHGLHLSNAPGQVSTSHYLVIGPWDHAGTRAPKREFGGLVVGQESLLDLMKLHLEWYGWTMRGGPKPAFLHKNVAYYVMGADRWRYADRLQDATARRETFFLGSNGYAGDVFHSGVLARQLESAGEHDEYIYDPSDTSLAPLESTLDPANRIEQRLMHAGSGKQLIYHGTPFDRDVEVVGFFKLSVWLSIDQPDTDFRAAIYEIGLDGGAVQLTSDTLRARYRRSFRHQELIRTTEPLRYDFERFPFVARRIKRGSRLRLVIGAADSIFWQKNYNSGGVVADESICESRRVTVRLFHDALRPSVLYIPYGGNDEGQGATDREEP